METGRLQEGHSQRKAADGMKEGARGTQGVQATGVSDTAHVNRGHFWDEEGRFTKKIKDSIKTLKRHKPKPNGSASHDSFKIYEAKMDRMRKRTGQPRHNR